MRYTNKTDKMPFWKIFLRTVLVLLLESIVFWLGITALDYITGLGFGSRDSVIITALLLPFGVCVENMFITRYRKHGSFVVLKSSIIRLIIGVGISLYWYNKIYSADWVLSVNKTLFDFTIWKCVFTLLCAFFAFLYQYIKEKYLQKRNKENNDENNEMPDDGILK